VIVIKHQTRRFQQVIIQNIPFGVNSFWLKAMLSKEACQSTIFILTNQETNSTICTSTTHMEVLKLEQPTKVFNQETNSKLDLLFLLAVSSSGNRDMVLCGAVIAQLHMNQSKLL
jgi:hypothetical protein